ncbi:MAG: uracil-DNA glycosylase family protein [Bacteroidia bacterium]
MLLSEKIKAFNRQLDFTDALPAGIKVMNPFRESETVLNISDQFYDRFYADERPRHLILGINPGRLGAGATGIPFTDTKRLKSDCNIPFEGLHTHEPSSVFVYEVIRAMGGAEAFYDRFFINSVSPLGFTIRNDKGRDVNYNYYDSKELTKASLPFIRKSMTQLIELGMETDVVYCLGTGKNAKFLIDFNKEAKLFNKVEPLEHPRYVVQYKSKKMPEYVAKFVRILNQDTI